MNCQYPQFASSTAYAKGCRCSPCRKAMSVRNAKYHAHHRARLNAKKQKWRDSSLGKALMKSRNAAYIQTPHGKAISTAKQAKQRAIRIGGLGCVPPLTLDESKRMYEIYKKSQDLSESTGVLHHVDHIVPISKKGLHHPDNLQVLTASENMKKRDKIV